MSLVCRKCQQKILGMQRELEEIEQTPHVEDIRKLARILHNTLSMMAGHGDALPTHDEKAAH